MKRLSLSNIHRWFQLWHSPWLFRFLLLLLGLSALVNLWSAFQPEALGRLPWLQLLSLDQLATSRLLKAYLALFLLFLIPSLLRRQRSAWWLTEGLLGITVLLSVISGEGLEAAILQLILGLLFFAKRRTFVVPVTRPVALRFVTGIAVVLLLSFIYALVGWRWFTEYSLPPTGGMAAREWLAALLGRSRLEGLNGFSNWFVSSVAMVFWTGVLLISLRALSPLALRTLAPLEDRERARALVEAYGHSSLAHFTLLGDKRYFFTPYDQACIAYTVERGVGLALGDPIGEPQAIALAIEEFQAFCQRNAWKPVFVQVLPDYLASYRQAGLYVLPMGQEAVVDLAEFSTSGKAGKNFRAATNQLHKAGYQARYYEPPQSDARIAALKDISDTWLAEKHGSEKAFSVGVFETEYIKQSALMVLEDSQGQAVAFANLVSEFQKNELTLDLMRSREGLPEDSMLYLFVAILSHAKESGYDSFNLGLAALSGLRGGREAPLEERILATIFERFNQFYNFKGLAHFKNKFHPRWEMRYLVYPGRSDLVAALTAIAAADSSEGLWTEVWQEVRRRLEERNEARRRPSESEDGIPEAPT